VLTVEGSLDAAAIPGLGERLASLIQRSGTDLVTCDVGVLDSCDLVVIDALARMELIARRLGCTVQVSRASDQLVELIAFAGLQEVLPVCRPDGGGAPGAPGA
jgi:ABC-type transporter Mla MlaB component